MAVDPSRHGSALSRLLAILLLAGMAPLWAAPDRASPTNPGGSAIDGNSIRKLERELGDAAAIESTTERRRLLKNVVRHALALVERQPDSPNRFQVLGWVFEAQRELLLMRNDPRSQEDLLETCRQLVAAPDAYAGERLQAEILLLQLDLDTRGATDHQRAVAIAELADRYRNTEAEVDSLMLASELAFNLGQADLLGAFRYTLSRKFKENDQAIEFLRERFAFNSHSLQFRGCFKRADGEMISFPTDRMGHVYLSCFWSKNTLRLEERLLAVKALQQKYAGLFEVLSFNLDELPDAGKNHLAGLGLDWTPMHLPGGANNPRLRAYGPDSEFLIRITNLNGYTTLTPIGSITRGGGRILDLEDYLVTNLEKTRYLSLFQSLRVGEFLILDPFEPFDSDSPPELKVRPGKAGERVGAGPGGGGNMVPGDTLRAIQACFTVAPMRYRLSPDEARKAYKKSAELCAAAIGQYPGAENLWVVHNRRIIALLGLWNLSAEPKYIGEAVKDANTVVGMNVPKGAEIPARFCLALQTLRLDRENSKQAISGFIKAAGGDDPSGPAIAAATVLALNAAEPELFEDYRSLLLKDHMDNPGLWSLISVLFEKSTYLRLFRANSWGSEIMTRQGMLRQFLSSEAVPRKFGMVLQTPSGSPLEFPDRDADKMNVVIFMEVPANEASAEIQRELMTRIEEHAGTHLHENVNIVLAFLGGDTKEINALVGKTGWPHQVAVVPEGVWNPHVLRLGVFLADQRPNTFVVRHDGTIVWSIAGMNQLASSTNAVAGRIRDLVREHELAVASRSLQDGDFEKALRYFEGSFPLESRIPSEVMNAKRMGRARANLRLGNPEKARQDLDAMIGEHAKVSGRSDCACHGLAALLLGRADMLEKLGKETDAAADRERAACLACPPAGKATELDARRCQPEIYRKLDSFGTDRNWQGAFESINDIIVHGKDGKQAERNELAGWLRERAEALTHLGEPGQATQDLLRADALTEGLEAHDPGLRDAQETGDEMNPRRYADVVREESE